MRKQARYLAQIVALCDPVDRFERKLYLEKGEKNLEVDLPQLLEDVRCDKQQMAFAHVCGRTVKFADAIRSWQTNFPGRILFVEKDLQSAPETRSEITDFLHIRPKP